MREYIFSIFKKTPGETESLNGIRALAFFMVLLYHLALYKTFLPPGPGILHTVLSNFASGVDLFFILSGFLISAGLLRHYEEKQKVNFKDYFWKRTLRIFPAYYFHLLCALLIILRQFFGGSADPALATNIPKILENWPFDFFYISNFFEHSLVPHGWSLSLEEQFYLVFPFFAAYVLFRMPFRKRLLLLSGLYLLVSGLRFYYAWLYPEELGVQLNRIYHFTQTRADCVIIGIIAMEIFFNAGRLFKGLTAGISGHLTRLIALLLLFAGFFTSPADNPVFYNTLRYNCMNLGLALFLLQALREKGFPAKLLGLPIFRPAARLSYTMYLWHIFLAGGVLAGFLAIWKTFSWPQFIVVLVSTYLILFIFSWVLHLVIEKPFLDLKERHSPSADLHKVPAQSSSPKSARRTGLAVFCLNVTMVLPLLLALSILKPLGRSVHSNWILPVHSLLILYVLTLLFAYAFTLIKYRQTPAGKILR